MIGDIVLRLDRIGKYSLNSTSDKKSLQHASRCSLAPVSILLRLISFKRFGVKGLGGAPQLMKMGGS